MTSPEEDVHSVATLSAESMTLVKERRSSSQETKEDESPTNRINDDSLASLSELVDHGAEKQEVNQRPNVERL